MDREGRGPGACAWGCLCLGSRTRRSESTTAAAPADQTLSRYRRALSLAVRVQVVGGVSKGVSREIRGDVG
eukprot:3243592-Rhodomonas_salina.1